jgi:hypothetical protein
MNKISENPSVSGKYQVWHIPYEEFSAGSWQYGYYDMDENKWYVYNSTAGRYKITHWEYVPNNPPKWECDEGLLTDHEEIDY